MYDFERLYIWRKARRFRSPIDVAVVLPKEIDIPSMIEFYQDRGRLVFPDFLKYVEYFGGREADLATDMPIIDPLAEVNRGSWAWFQRGVDTKKIGIKEFVPVEDEIRSNEERLLASVKEQEK